MDNFSYVWFFTCFLLQAMSTGMVVAKLGEDKKGKYTGVDLFINLMFFVLAGVALYFWPQS